HREVRMQFVGRHRKPAPGDDDARPGGGLVPGAQGREGVDPRGPALSRARRRGRREGRAARYRHGHAPRGRGAGRMISPLAIVHTENSCGWGGQEIRILTESRGFLDRGHRVTLLAPPEAPIVEAARRMAIPVVTLRLREKRLPDLLALRRWLAAHRTGIDVLN